MSVDTEPTTEPGTAVERHEPAAAPAPTAGAGMPSPREWQMIQHMADTLAMSDLVPTAYRRKPANIILASLAGRPFGWDPSMSMRSFHVIEGVPSMKPEIMLALVRRAGHSVTGEVTGQGPAIAATVTGTRCDTGDTMTFDFSVDDAVTAGLCRIQDGAIRARSSSGKVLPWEQFPKSMVWARALSQLARMLFPDVVLGAGYTPEELGAKLADDDVIDLEDLDGVHVEVATVGENGAKNRLVQLADGDKAAAQRVWDDRPDALRKDGDAVTGVDDDGKLRLRVDAFEAWATGIDFASTTGESAPAADEDIVDAEVVETPTSDQTEEERQAGLVEDDGHPLNVLLLDGIGKGVHPMKYRVDLIAEARDLTDERRALGWDDLRESPYVDELLRRHGAQTG